MYRSKTKVRRAELCSDEQIEGTTDGWVVTPLGIVSCFSWLNREAIEDTYRGLNAGTDRELLSLTFVHQGYLYTRRETRKNWTARAIARQAHKFAKWVVENERVK